MKHFKTLIVAAAALMAFATTASASTLTSPEGTTYTGEIVATSTNSEIHMTFVSIKCSHSGIKFKVEQHGAANAGGKVSSLTFTGCNYSTTVIKPGSLEITSSNAILSKGFEIAIHTSVGTCIITTFETGTNVGTLSEGKNASWNINAAKIPRTGGNFLCGSSMTWTGSYDFTTPNDLWVD